MYLPNSLLISWGPLSLYTKNRWATPPVRLGLSGRNSGKTPETLSERFLEFPSRVRLGCPKPYNSRHLKAPEHLQNSLPPSTAGDASFFRSGSGEGLSEPVMQFPAVLGVYLNRMTPKNPQQNPRQNPCLQDPHTFWAPQAPEARGDEILRFQSQEP